MFNPLADIVLAYRLCYYVYARPLVPDHEYDVAEKQAILTVGPDHLLHFPGSDQIESYPASIRALALYLELREAEESRRVSHSIPGILPPRESASAAEALDFDIPEEEEPASRGAKKEETPSLF